MDPYGQEMTPPLNCDIDCKERCKDQVGTTKTGCIAKCKSNKKSFNDWYNRNRDITWIASLPVCPCNIWELLKTTNLFLLTTENTEFTEKKNLSADYADNRRLFLNLK
ncbi:MAG: hypothetical protein LBP87_05950 [Planctomycetaceae bacterium]|nr:hypothetical protein [Planctomycetaceae bacterium]